MSDSTIHAQLHRTGRGELLLKLAEMTAEGRSSYVSHHRLAEASGMTDQDVLFQLAKLRDADLAASSGRASSGWRLTLEGVRIAAGLLESLEEGQLRLEHTMRSILENLKATNGHAARTAWMSWELHEDGRAAVTHKERLQALDLLGEGRFIKSLNAQASHLRIEITSRGRTVLARPDVLLTGGLFGREYATNVDQRIGIQAQTFHNVGGAIQAGDYNSQHIAITNGQLERINDGIAATRAALSRKDLEERVRNDVNAALDDLESAAAQQAEKGVLHALITKATIAAAGAAGSAAGSAVIQNLAAIGAALV